MSHAVCGLGSSRTARDASSTKFDGSTCKVPSGTSSLDESAAPDRQLVCSMCCVCVCVFKN